MVKEDIYVLLISDPSDAPFIGSAYEEKDDAISEAERLVRARRDDDDTEILKHDGFGEDVTVELDDRSDRYYVKVSQSQLNR
jgi:hypothetical protein